MSKTLNALKALLHTMETPRSRAATEAWSAALAIVSEPAPVPASDLMETAMCLWEAVTDRAERDDIKEALGAIGWGQIRLEVMALAEPCHRDWEVADFADSFDWEYVPQWLQLNVAFDSRGVRLASERRQPDMETAA